MPNELNRYRDVHQQAKTAIQQARELRKTILRDPNTKKYLYVLRRLDDYRAIHSNPYDEILSIPEEYSAKIKDVLLALYAAQAVVKEAIHYPDTPKQKSRDRFQKELAEIFGETEAMGYLQNKLPMR